MGHSLQMRSAAFLLSGDEPDRPNVRAEREAQALRGAGWDYEIDRLTLLPAPGRGLLSRARWFRQYTRSLAGMTLGTDPPPDIVIAHDVYTLPAGRRAARKLRVPLIYDAHENWPFLVGEHSRVEAALADWIERRPYGRKPDHVFTVSGSIAGRFRRMGLPTTVLYNARPSADIARLPRAASRQTLGLGEDDFVVGYIGKLSLFVETKMFEQVWEAVARTPNMKLLLVGGPAGDASVLRWDANAAGITGRVRIVPPKPFSELAPYYGALDVGLMALDSRPNHMVSLGNKLFDYMAFGVPVVSPPAPEVSSILHATGAGVATDDIADMLCVLSEDELIGMGGRGRVAFLERFAWERQAPGFVRVVEDLCAS